MKGLNGWQRIGIVASIVWMIGGPPWLPHVDASNFHDASAQFRERWPLIESLARDFIRSGTPNDAIEVSLPQS
jgi:hypothetical protein